MFLRLLSGMLQHKFGCYCQPKSYLDKLGHNHEKGRPQKLFSLVGNQKHIFSLNYQHINRLDILPDILLNHSVHSFLQCKKAHIFLYGDLHNSQGSMDI